jgi:hypothetical protein
LLSLFSPLCDAVLSALDNGLNAPQNARGDFHWTTFLPFEEAALSKTVLGFEKKKKEFILSSFL